MCLLDTWTKASLEDMQTTTVVAVRHCLGRDWLLGSLYCNNGWPSQPEALLRRGGRGRGVSARIPVSSSWYSPLDEPRLLCADVPLVMTGPSIDGMLVCT